MKPGIKCYRRVWLPDWQWFACCRDGRYLGVGEGETMIEAAQSAYKAFMAVPRHE